MEGVSLAQAEEKTLLVLCALVAAGILFTVYAIFSANALSNQFSGVKPAASPAVLLQPEKPKIEIAVVKPPACESCVDLSGFTQSLAKTWNAEIAAEKTIEFKDASQLIAKYGIKRLPAVILTGETAKVPGIAGQWAQFGEVKPDGAMVLTKVPPVYYDVESKKFVGLLKAIRVSAYSCSNCTEATVLQERLQSGAGIKFSEEEEAEFNTTRWQELVAQYNITKLPSLIVTGETGAYQSLRNAWTQVGTMEGTGALVWRSVSPPYQELPSRKIRGLVTMIALQDEKCKECYDVGLHERILGSYGVVVGNLTYLNYSVPWQQKLIDKYNITFLPTVLVDGEMDEYYNFTSLGEVWQMVGTTEADGWHVFRNVTALGGNVTFSNLTSNKTETTPSASVTDNVDDMH